MSKWEELKKSAEEAMPKCCGESIPTGVEYGGHQEMICCDAWQCDGEVTVNPFDLLELVKENEYLKGLKEHRIECIKLMGRDADDLRGALDAICETLPMEYIGPANGGINELAGDFARMAKDAERYRFIRDISDFDQWEMLASISPDEWDAAIDASMSKEK